MGLHNVMADFHSVTMSAATACVERRRRTRCHDEDSTSNTFGYSFPLLSEPLQVKHVGLCKTDCHTRVKYISFLMRRWRLTLSSPRMNMGRSSLFRMSLARERLSEWRACQSWTRELHFQTLVRCQFLAKWPKIVVHAHLRSRRNSLHRLCLYMQQKVKLTIVECAKPSQ